MPELFGVCAADSLSTKHKAAFASMREDFTPRQGGRMESTERAWAAWGITGHHPYDPARQSENRDAQTIWSWIGKGPARTDSIQADQVAEQILRGEDRLLLQLEPRFAACMVDEKTRTLRLVSDRFGFMPVYFSCQDGALLFATKFHPLARTGLIPSDLDSAALADFLTFEHLTGDRTLWRHIQVQSPAAVLTFSGGNVNQRRYRAVLDEVVVAKTGTPAPLRLRDALMTGVSQALAGVENVSVTLSGGLDSRAVLHCAHALGKPIRAYSFGLPRCRDLVFARRQAEILGVPLTAVEVDGSFLPAWLRFGVYQTGGMIGCMHFHILALAERLAGSELVLDGQGGDAWTGAHLKGPMFRRGNVESAARRLHRMRASGWSRPSKWDSLLQPDLGQAVRRADPLEAVRGHLRGLAPADRWKGCHAFDILERQRRFIQFGPHLLQPMTHVAIPFCSNAFVEAAASLSPRELLGQRAYIAMHVEYLRDLAGVPDSARGLPLTVPRPIRFAKKVYDHAARRSRRLPIFPRGLRAPTTDYANWFRASLNPLLRERLLDGAPILHDVFRPEALQLLVSEHESGRADHGSKFGCLIALSVWRDLLKSPPPAIPASLSVSC